MVDYLYEHATQFPGITMGKSFVRHYPYHSLAAQVLGYVGEVSPTELRRLGRQGYVAGDQLGQSGVEAAYDSYLRGVAGAARLHIDALGRPLGTLKSTTQYKSGNALRP